MLSCTKRLGLGEEVEDEVSIPRALTMSVLRDFPHVPRAGQALDTEERMIKKKRERVELAQMTEHSSLSPLNSKLRAPVNQNF